MQWCRRGSQKLGGGSACIVGSLLWDELDELSVAVCGDRREVDTGEPAGTLKGRSVMNHTGHAPVSDVTAGENTEEEFEDFNKDFTPPGEATQVSHAES